MPQASQQFLRELDKKLWTWADKVMSNLPSNIKKCWGGTLEGDIRRALVEADLIECMVDLPGRLFTDTQIPACMKNKGQRTRPGDSVLRGRRGETLFIDARKLGFMKDRRLEAFASEDIEKNAA